MQPAAPAGFVQASGGEFVVNGAPRRFAGTNALALAQFADAYERADVLARAAAANLTLLRLWAFADGGVCAPAPPPPPAQRNFQCWNASSLSVSRDEAALAAHLDAALADAARAGVYVILTLVNNWNAYGGMNAYVDWRARAAAAGVAPPYVAPAHDDFYVDATMRAWYREWVEAVVGRVNTLTGVAYRDDPTIFAYEVRARALGSAARARGRPPRAPPPRAPRRRARPAAAPARPPLSPHSSPPALAASE